MSEHSERPVDARTAWEEHYGATSQVWSGRVNAQLARIVPGLPVGRALDLGCGEGGDVVWLADQGWTVVGADISATALDRARAAAVARGVSDRVELQQHDLTVGFPAGSFDLVSAQFLHSPVELDRSGLLRRAVAAVAPGGSILIVDHAAAPPWASRLHHHDFPDAESVVAGLRLDDRLWEPVEVGPVQRDAVGPDGREAVLTDNVIWIRRAGPGPSDEGDRS